MASVRDLTRIAQPFGPRVTWPDRKPDEAATEAPLETDADAAAD